MNFWKIVKKQHNDAGALALFFITRDRGEAKWLYEVVHVVSGERRIFAGSGRFQIGDRIPEGELQLQRP